MIYINIIFCLVYHFISYSIREIDKIISTLTILSITNSDCQIDFFVLSCLIGDNKSSLDKNTPLLFLKLILEMWRDRTYEIKFAILFSSRIIL